MQPHTIAAIASLEAHYGHRFSYKPAHQPIWEQALDHRDPNLVEAAVARVVHHHQHGAPGLAEIRQALDGVWGVKKVTRTDCHGNPKPELGQEILTVLCEYGTGIVVRALDPQGNRVDPDTLRILARADQVEPSLPPPAGTVREMIGGAS